MKQYDKIQTVYLRDPSTNYKTLLFHEFAKDEFMYLANMSWLFTEKVDGMNIRVKWNGGNVYFKGKTDRAEIPKHLEGKLTEMFPRDLMKSVFPNVDNVCLYGEGYGYKIQNGGDYIRDDVSFILFDVKINDKWLSFYDSEDVAKKLIIKHVPLITIGSLFEGIDMVRLGLESRLKEGLAEGLVMKPFIDLYNSKGERIITKIKTKDFRKKL